MTIKTTLRYAIPYPGDDENVDVPTDLANGFTKVDDALSGLADDIEAVSAQASDTTGRSAYQDAVANGYVGTLQEWLESLHGASAYQAWLDLGNNGTEADFLATLEGDSAYQAWLDAGNTGTVTDFLASLKGEKGDKGDPGDPGTAGATTLDGLTDVDLTTDPAAEGEVLIKRGTAWVPEPIPHPPVPALIDDLADVTAGSPTGGHVLTYNATTGQWEPAAATGGTGTTATTLDELTDVDTATVAPTIGQTILWDGSLWKPGAAGPTTLDGLTDVDAATAVDGQVLTRQGSQWVPATPSATGATATVVTVGSVTGSNSSGTYSAATTTLTVRAAMTLHKLSFQALTAATYTLVVGGATVGTVTKTGTTGETVTFTGMDVSLPAGDHTVQITAGGTKFQTRYVSATSIVYAGDTYDFTAAGWTELSASYTLPYIYEISTGGSTGGATTLDDLTDVDTTTVAPTEGQSLVYRSGRWVPGEPSAAPSTDVQGVLVIPLGGVVPTDTPEGTLIFERTT